jgi:hypothetical protein
LAELEDNTEKDFKKKGMCGFGHCNEFPDVVNFLISLSAVILPSQSCFFA